MKKHYKGKVSFKMTEAHKQGEGFKERALNK